MKALSVDRNHPKLSVSRQCRLLSISRSGLYYDKKGESAFNLELMRRLPDGASDRDRPRQWLRRKHAMGGKGIHRHPDERPTCCCASFARARQRATLRGRRHDPGEGRMREIYSEGPAGHRLLARRLAFR